NPTRLTTTASLTANDTMATGTNRLKRLPTLVRSLVWTAVTILVSWRVMWVLVLRRPSGHPDRVNSTGGPGGGRAATSGFCLGHVIVRTGRMQAMWPA